MKRVLATIMTAAVISGQMLFAGFGIEVNTSAGNMEGNDYLANEQEAAPALEDWMLTRSAPASVMMVQAESQPALESWMISNVLNVQPVIREAEIEIEDWMISSPADAMKFVPETEISTEDWMLQLIPDVQEPGIILENWMFDFHR